MTKCETSEALTELGPYSILAGKVYVALCILVLGRRQGHKVKKSNWINEQEFGKNKVLPDKCVFFIWLLDQFLIFILNISESNILNREKSDMWNQEVIAPT